MPYTPPKQPTYEDFEDGDGDEDQQQRMEENDDEDEDEIRMKRAQLRAKREQMETGEERVNTKKSRSVDDDGEELHIVNPYETDETSYFIPILVAIGAFIPLLFCLCKL